MSTATSSVTTSDPSWAAPANQAVAQQWQSQEQYQQYYNYYQAMSQASAASTAPVAPAAPVAPVAAAVTSTATDPNAAYPQDYSKAWDEYYKAYYGQSYTVSAPPTQYPATAYNYDQYGYPNLAAPPPVYQYDSVSTSTAYQYSQPQVAPVAPLPPATTNAYGYADPSYTTPTASTWNEPPPSYEKPATYNQSYQQQSYDKTQSFDQNNSYAPTDPSRPSTESVTKNDNYFDRFPPPSFDSSNKPDFRSSNRGRGYNKGDQRPTDNRDDNFRRPPRGNRGQSKVGRGNFNDRSQYDNEDSSQYNNRAQQNSFDRPPFKNNDFQDGDSSFGGRGGRGSYRGRGGDSSFRGRGGESALRGRGGDSSFRGRGAYESNNRRFSGGDNQSWDTEEETQDFAWKSEFEKPEVTKESPWDTEEESVLPGWTMGGAAQKRKAPSNFDDGTRLPKKVAPVALMDIAVRPSVQSSIIVRRQALIDQWQVAVRDIVDRKLPIQQFWTTLKSGLVPEVQGLLCPSFVRGDNTIHCELHLDDIFLVQSKGVNEDMAIEEASKSMWQMLQTKLHVHTASRSWGVEKVPVFCVSRSVSGPVSCPPFIKGVAPGAGAASSGESHQDAFYGQFKGEANRSNFGAPRQPIQGGVKFDGSQMQRPGMSGGPSQGPVKFDGPQGSRSAIGGGSAPGQGKFDFQGPRSGPTQGPRSGMGVPLVPTKIDGPRPAPGAPIVAAKPLPSLGATPTPAPATKVETPAKTTPPVASSPVAPKAAATTGAVPHDYKDDDIFLVVDPSLNEKDQAISILNNTAKFNKITIEYKHEKPAHAPHISQCLITINGQEFEKSEARDYLFAKREAADKAVVIFKESCPQITLNFDNATEVERDAVMKPGRSSEESLGDFLRSFAANSDEDCIYKFGAPFTAEDRETIMKMTGNLTLSTRTEGKSTTMVYKQYPIEDMKRRLLRHGRCAQYRLVPATGGDQPPSNGATGTTTTTTTNTTATTTTTSAATAPS